MKTITRVPAVLLAVAFAFTVMPRALSAATPAASTHRVPSKWWVYFNDKGDGTAPADEALALRLAAVRGRLTPHAAARRAKVLGPALVDVRDLPVSAAYVHAIENAGATAIHESRWLNAVSVRASAEALVTIAALPFVREIVPVAVGRGGEPAPPTTAGPDAGGTETPSITSDPFNYGPSRDQLAEIQIVQAHSIGLSGRGVIIAMLDTGYRRTHTAFQTLIAEGRLLAQHDFINNDNETMNEPGDSPSQDLHGTATWSIVGGYRAGQLVGAAHGASFLLAKTEDVTSETPIEEDHWVAAMEWADSLGADIISSSLSYIDWYTYEDMDGDTAPVTNAADIAASRGIVVATGAGNWATQDWYYIGAPADADSILAVGGTNADGTRWDLSSHGPSYDGRTKPEVMARGNNTWCAWVLAAAETTSFRSASGTSVSTPLVAGAAALLLEANASLTPMAVRNALMMTADQSSHPDNDRGWGRIRVMDALSYAATEVPAGTLGAPPAGGQLGTSLRAHPNPFSERTDLFVRNPSAVAGAGAIEIFSVTGARVRAITAPEDRPASWDGRDDEGRALPPGVYLVISRGGPEVALGKIVLRR